MTRPVVADTGPLIALARIERLDLLRRLYERVVVPPAVHVELALDSDRPGARVFLAAKSRGEVAAVGPVLEALSNTGYRFSSRLIAGVLARTGE